MAEKMELELENTLPKTEGNTPDTLKSASEKPLKKSGKSTGKKKGKKKKKKKIGGILFAIFMILYVAAACAGIYYGLTFLWSYMESYEASRPSNTVQAYMAQLTPEHIVDMNQNVIDQIDHNLQSEEECRRIMMAELEGGVRHAKKTKECTDTRMVYVLRTGSKVVGEFVIEANAPDSYGFTTWKVTGESFDLSYLIGESDSVTVPDSCVVTVNGIALDEKYIVEDNIPYEEIREYYDDYELPCKVTYEAGPLLGEMEMLVTDANGEEVVFDENTDWSVYYLTCSDEQMEKLDDFAAMFLDRYVAFTGSNKNTRYATYDRLIQHILEGSDLAARLKNAIEGLQFGQSKGDEIVAINVHLYIAQNGKYLVDLTYDVDTTGKEGVVRTTTNARLLIVETEKGLKVESIQIY